MHIAAFPNSAHLYSKKCSFAVNALLFNLFRMSSNCDFELISTSENCRLSEDFDSNHSPHDPNVSPLSHNAEPQPLIEQFLEDKENEDDEVCVLSPKRPIVCSESN